MVWVHMADTVETNLRNIHNIHMHTHLHIQLHPTVTTGNSPIILYHTSILVHSINRIAMCLPSPALHLPLITVLTYNILQLEGDDQRI